MKKFALLITLLSTCTLTGLAEKQGSLLGIVSIAPAEANNSRFIKGAIQQAAQYGWRVQVIDAQGAADQANTAIQNLVTRGAGAIIDMVFPTTSLRASLLAAQRASIPVATWGGGMDHTIAATNGSGGPMAVPVIEELVKDLGGKGSLLALTYHTGQVAREREQELDRILAKYPQIKVTKNEVRIPGYLQDGAQYAAAWLASHPAGSGPLAIWGSWDDPALGAISALKQQHRKDVKVYGENGNANAILAIRDGWMTATAWQNSVQEGQVLVETLKAAMDAGKNWQQKAVEVPAVLVTTGNITQFLQDHPDSIGQ